MSNEEEIERILEKWDKYKKELSEIEKKVQKYKEQVEAYMNVESTNSLDTKNYYLTRINCSKSTVSKKDVPEDIWNKYSKRSKYWMYTLKKKK